MSTSSLPDGDAQTSAFFGDCTPAEDCEAVIEKSHWTVRRFWELVSELRSFGQNNWDWQFNPGWQCADWRSLVPLEKTRDFGMTPRGGALRIFKLSCCQNNLQRGAGADMIREP